MIGRNHYAPPPKSSTDTTRGCGCLLALGAFGLSVAAVLIGAGVLIGAVIW